MPVLGLHTCTHTHAACTAERSREPSPTPNPTLGQPCTPARAQVGERTFVQLDKGAHAASAHPHALQLAQTLYWVLCLLPLEPFFPGALRAFESASR